MTFQIPDPQQTDESVVEGRRYPILSQCYCVLTLFSVFLSVFSVSIISFSRNLTISIENNTTFQSGCMWNQKARPWWLNYSVRDPGVPQLKVSITKLWYTHGWQDPGIMVPLRAVWSQSLYVHHFMFNKQLWYVASWCFKRKNLHLILPVWFKQAITALNQCTLNQKNHYSIFPLIM